MSATRDDDARATDDPAPPVDPASPLAGVVEHDDVRRLAAALRATPGRAADVAGAEPPPRWAAVALVLRVGETGALELLFIKRAEFEGDPWSGHVAFPGGRGTASIVSIAKDRGINVWEPMA